MNYYWRQQIPWREFKGFRSLSWLFAFWIFENEKERTWGMYFCSTSVYLVSWQSPDLLTAAATTNNTWLQNGSDQQNYAVFDTGGTRTGCGTEIPNCKTVQFSWNRQQIVVVILSLTEIEPTFSQKLLNTKIIYSILK